MKRQLSSLVRRRFDGTLGPRKPHWRKQKVAKFKKTHGYTPNLDEPKTFNEKLLNRIMNQADPFYPIYANKLMAPHFANMQMGNSTNLKHARRIKILKEVEVADLWDLPDSYAIKGMYGAGKNILKLPNEDSPREDQLKQLNFNVREAYTSQNFRVPWPGLVIEELLYTKNKAVPDDLRFHCFEQPGGRKEIILQIDRKVDGRYRRSFFDSNFCLLPLMIGPWKQPDTPFEKPQCLAEAWKVATKLSAGFDYIRVDLYDVDGQIYFGEFTPFNASANAPFSSVEWDHYLGSLWNQREVAYYDPQEPFVSVRSEGL